MRSRYLVCLGGLCLFTAASFCISGCGGSIGSSGGTSAPQTPEYLYASGSYDMQVFKIDLNSGHLTPIQTVSTSGQTSISPTSFSQSVASTPANFLYFAGLVGVDAYTIGSDGRLTLLNGSPFLWPSQYPGWHPTVSAIAISPNNKNLYGAPAGYGTSVLGFQIDSATGALTAMPSEFDIGDGLTAVPLDAVIDPSGKSMYVIDPYAVMTMTASYAGIAELSIDPSSGNLTPLSNSPALLPYNSDPHSIVIDPTGKFVYVSSDQGDGVFGLIRNPVTGELTQMSGSPFNIDVGIAGDGVPMDIHPSGKFLYTSNYDGSFGGYSIDPVSGNLSPIAGSPFPTQGPIGGCFIISLPCGVQSLLLIDPSGKFAYSDQQTDQSGQPSIAIYSVNETTGALSRAGGSPEVTSEQLFGLNAVQNQ
jgi:6-phosphogluconolactonase (cycloisomerase 2 family)